jgi:hypothetical protein
MRLTLIYKLVLFIVFCAHYNTVGSTSIRNKRKQFDTSFQLPVDPVLKGAYDTLTQAKHAASIIFLKTALHNTRIPHDLYHIIIEYFIPKTPLFSPLPINNISLLEYNKHTIYILMLSGALVAVKLQKNPPSPMQCRHPAFIEYSPQLYDIGDCNRARYAACKLPTDPELCHAVPIDVYTPFADPYAHLKKVSSAQPVKCDNQEDYLLACAASPYFVCSNLGMPPPSSLTAWRVYTISRVDSRPKTPLDMINSISHNLHSPHPSKVRKVIS